MPKRARSEENTEDAVPLTAAPHRAPLDSMRSARLAWFSASTEADLKLVESYYKERMSALKREREATKSLTSSILSCEEREVRDKLILLLMQSGRGELAVGGLQAMNYTTTLARCVLNYDFSNNETKREPSSHSSSSSVVEEPPCIVAEQALSPAALASLRSALASLSAPYWEGYSVEPPSPYFSYVAPLSNLSQLGALGTLIRTVHALGVRRFGVERMKAVAYAEVWAHNRPHASGHQLHFDSDDEGRGGVRHPVVSSVCFLKGEVGGPTLFTNQRLGDHKLGTKAWLCAPKENRVAVFDGSVLHGVIPGKGPSTDVTKSRVTLMVALWEEITIRPGEGRGSARPFPPLEKRDAAPLWAQQLTAGTLEAAPAPTSFSVVAPLSLPCLWETAQLKPWPLNAPIPPYDAVYQGF